MAHISPTVNIVWATLAVMLGTFLIYHLWAFDRFKCLRWNYGPHSGGFKRVMTYSYLLSVPLIIAYTVGFAIIKSTYGFSVTSGIEVIPMPYEAWSQSAQDAILPLYLSFSFAWGLEIVTHLEELCFWLFLVKGSIHQDWFQSSYFKTWAVGSCVSVVAMPLITIFTRSNVDKCEAYTLLTGGLVDFCLTIWFLPVLWTFPAFLSSLKDHDVEAGTLVRLTTFHELNCIRIVFRFLFAVPFIILGIDGVQPHQHINDKMFVTDFLAIVGAIGCIISSGITLVIFFPRSVKGEMAAKVQRRARSRSGRGQFRTLPTNAVTDLESNMTSYISVAPSKTDLDKLTMDGPGSHAAPSLSFHNLNADFGFGTRACPPAAGADLGKCGMLPTYKTVSHTQSPSHEVTGKFNVPLSTADRELELGPMGFKPNRLNCAGDVELGAVLTESEVDMARGKGRESRVSELVYRWRSPIEIERPMVSVGRWRREI